MTLFQKFLLAAFAATLAFALTHLPIPDEKQRMLTDAAVREIIRQYPPQIKIRELRLPDGTTRVIYRKPTKPIFYESVSDFYTQNPGCCVIVDGDPEGYWPSLTDKLLGYTFYIVRVRYSVKYTDSNGAIKTIPEEYYVKVRPNGKVTHI